MTQDLHKTDQPFLSRNPEKAIKQALASIQAVHDVYERETKALTDADMDMFSQLQEEKIQAAHIYQQSIEDILKRKEELKTVSPSFKSKLKDMQNEFSVLAKRNVDALERMQRNLKRVGETIQRAARNAAEKHHNLSYSAHGRLQDQKKKTVSIGVSETA